MAVLGLKEEKQNKLDDTSEGMTSKADFWLPLACATHKCVHATTHIKQNKARKRIKEGGREQMREERKERERE